MNPTGISAFVIFLIVFLVTLWYRDAPGLAREWWTVTKFRWQMRKK